MIRTSSSGREIAKVLRNHGYRPVSRTGSPLRLRSPDTDEVRLVTVPMKPEDDIPLGRYDLSLISAARMISRRGAGGSTRTVDQGVLPMSRYRSQKWCPAQGNARSTTAASLSSTSVDSETVVWSGWVASTVGSLPPTSTTVRSPRSTSAMSGSSRSKK